MEYLSAKAVNIKEADYSYPRRVSDAGITLKSKNRTVVGICAVFGNIDSGSDIVQPGAFKKAIAEFNAGRSRCLFLWSHIASEPPTARIIELKEVQRSELPAAYRGLLDVSGALQVTRQYFDDPYSDRIYQGVISKAISEMSFSYETVRFRIEKVQGKEVRVLEELDLLDCADVCFGMNPLTMAGIKGPEIVKRSEIPRLKELKIIKRRMQEFNAQNAYVMRQKRSPEIVKWDNFVASLGPRPPKRRSVEMRRMALDLVFGNL